MKRSLWLLGLLMALPACEPVVETFDEEMPCQLYEAGVKKQAPLPGNTLLVMTWNMRFGAGGKIGWFGDSCGDRVILGADEVLPVLEQIAARIEAIKPDIVLLQEIDIDAKRSAYIDQMQYLLDHTYLNYGVYASNWKSQFIPSDGLGRMDEGNAILSPWPLEDTKRYQLPLRNDIDALTRYFYVRENVMVARVNIPGADNIYAVSTHLAANSTDDTKQRQMDEFVSILQDLDRKGKYFVAGGDLNLVPPNADSTDYCMERACPGNRYHGPDDDPFHLEGANYDLEINWLNPLFDEFLPSLTLAEYKTDEKKYFTNAQINSDWNSTLDYLFSNSEWVPGSHQARQEAPESDHCPATALWIIPK
jgi:endonuclease/exonuclease/phosphatase family metal-dependent hydrolase